MTDKLLISLLALITALSIAAAFTNISAYEVFKTEETAVTENIDDEPVTASSVSNRRHSAAIPRNIAAPVFTTISETEATEETTEATSAEETTTAETTSEETVTTTEIIEETTTAEEETSVAETETIAEETAAPESTYCWEISEVFRLINEERAAVGASPLTLDDTLCSCAGVRAYEATVTTTHTRPDGRKWLSVYSDYGYSCTAYGECIAYGQSSPSLCVSTWMNDYAHRTILLDSAYTSVGIGIYTVGGGFDWVADFAG